MKIHIVDVTELLKQCVYDIILRGEKQANEF